MAKDTFHKGQFQTPDILDLPPEIEADIKKRGWTSRWINYNTLMKSGGQDRRGWMPYSIPQELRIEAKPNVYVEGAQWRSSVDGFFHNGDLILAVMPDTRFKLLRQSSMERTRHQEDITAAIRQDSPRVSVKNSEKRRGSLPSKKDILED